MDSPWSLDKDEILKKHNVTAAEGLSSQEVEEQRRKHGLNEIPAHEGTPLWKLILEQFQDQLVIILLLAATVSFVLALFEVC